MRRGRRSEEVMKSKISEWMRDFSSFDPLFLTSALPIFTGLMRIDSDKALNVMNRQVDACG
jgi:hypothetical protein